MKKVKILSLLFVAFAALTIFNSCNKEYALPTITWTGPVSAIVDFESEDNYDVNLAITFGAEAGLSEIHIYKYIHSGLDDLTTVEMTAPTGYADLTTFDYTFTDDNDASDFTGGVTKIVYEFVAIDAELQETTKEYTLFVIETYTLTFIVKDQSENVIADAVVTFNGVANAAGDYVFEHVEPRSAEYNYTVTKAGFDDVTGTFIMPALDTSINIAMVTSLTDWSAEIPLALYGQTSWASYNSTPVTNYFSNVIGVSFNFTDASTVRIEDTNYTGGSIGCEGWVIVTDIANLTTEASLASAYNSGTPIHQYDLPYDQHKAYAPVYFISKMGSTYKLVYYVAGHRDASTGNVVVFKYKD
jgi:hypothetical protein